MSKVSLTKARAIRKSNYLKKLGDKFVAAYKGEGSLTRGQALGRVYLTSKIEGLSFKQAAKKLYATRMFTSDEENAKHQIAAKITLEMRNEIRAYVANITGQKYRNVSININAMHWEKGIGLVDNTMTFAISISPGRDSTEPEFVYWQPLING